MELKHLAVLFIVLVSLSLKGQDKVTRPQVIETGEFIGISDPLIDIPEIPSTDNDAFKKKAAAKILNPKLRTRSFPHASTSFPKGVDKVWQRSHGVNRQASSSPNIVFNGQSSPFFPPDCNGASGDYYFMQAVNSSYAIYDKSGNKVAGPTNMNKLFGTVAGTDCNSGDPIILYDEMADRWLAAEFSICNKPYYMLVAVSASNNPTGKWYQYSFPMGDNLPDYEKFGVWHDGYYMATNTSGGNDIYVFERDVMLSGGANPRMIGFDNSWRPSEGFLVVPPVDNDGPPPPHGQPGIFIGFNDDAVGGGKDQLWIYELDADWTTPLNSTFARVQQLDVASFDSNFGLSWNNITQPNTSQKLDAVPQVIMNAPQYRNFGSYQTIVLCHTVDVDNTDHAGVRWYELRKTDANWTLRQQGTYAPDQHSRWMGSIRLNGFNELAIGYSISSSTEYPGIRYTGQTANEYLAASGVMDVPEGIIHKGLAAQVENNRWGDYSLLSIDPTDDETFWFTSQFEEAGRQTKIASFNIGPKVPKASFTADNKLPCLGTSTIIRSTSSGEPTSWLWEINPSTITYLNGTSNTSENPEVQFNAYGSYAIALKVTNDAGTNTTTIPSFISVNETNADFTLNNSYMVVDNPSTFVDQSSCNVSSWAWNFGEGATPQTANTQGPHKVTYSTTGSKTITLTVNGSITKTKTIEVVDDYFIMSNQNIYTCSGLFVDPGGEANYDINQSFTTTFYPSREGGQVSLDFTQFALQASDGCSSDYLAIYNGRNTLSRLIGRYCGTNSPGIVTSDNEYGALTVVFRSNTSVTELGWKATVTCEMVKRPTSFTATTYTDKRIDLEWQLNSTNDNIVVVYSTDGLFGTLVDGNTYPVGSTIPGGGTVLYSGTKTSLSHTSLIPLTTYHYRIYSVDSENKYSRAVSSSATTLSGPPVLTANPLKLDFNFDTGSTYINVSSNATWSVSSDATWCTVSKLGTGVISVQYTKNKIALTRTATITIQVNALDPILIPVTQLGPTPYLTIDNKTFNVDTLAGKLHVNVLSNAPWEVSSDMPWCTVTTSGTGDGIIVINYTNNPWVNKRTAIVTIKAAGLADQKISITQEGCPARLSITPVTIELPSNSGEAIISLNANFEWVASSNAEWLTFTKAGSGSSELKLNYTENFLFQPRSTIFTVTGNNMSTSANIVQSQAIPFISVDSLTPEVRYLPGTLTINVLSNTSWNCSVDSSWVKTTLSGSGNGIILVDYIQNPYYKDRTAVITISAEGTTPIKVILTQRSSELAINEITGGDIKIYPNPAGQYFKIEARGYENSIMEIIVKDSKGVVVQERTCKGEAEYTFDTSSMNDGLYTILLKTDKRIIAKKIVVIK